MGKSFFITFSINCQQFIFLNLFQCYLFRKSSASRPLNTKLDMEKKTTQQR